MLPDWLTQLLGAGAPQESDTQRDGLFSYGAEYHAATIGTAAGLLGALTHGTPTQPTGLAAMLAVTAVALGLKGHERLRNAKAAGEVRREPWYAVGAMVLAFFLGLLATTLA